MVWKSVAIGAALVSAVCSVGYAQAQNRKATGATPLISAPITAYANNNAEVVMSRGGQEYLRFGWMLWDQAGPGLDSKARQPRKTVFQAAK
jgi:hypothetical protein